MAGVVDRRCLCSVCLGGCFWIGQLVRVHMKGQRSPQLSCYFSPARVVERACGANVSSDGARNWPELCAPAGLQTLLSLVWSPVDRRTEMSTLPALPAGSPCALPALEQGDFLAGLQMPAEGRNRSRKTLFTVAPPRKRMVEKQKVEPTHGTCPNKILLARVCQTSGVLVFTLFLLCHVCHTCDERFETLPCRPYVRMDVIQVVMVICTSHEHVLSTQQRKTSSSGASNSCQGTK